MNREEQIAIEVLETIMNESSNPRNTVSTTIQNFSFTYEDLMSDRQRAYYIKKRLRSDEEVTMFRILRRRVLGREYSKISRNKKRTQTKQITTERCKIITKAYELFADHPKMQEFREFIQTLNAEQTDTDTATATATATATGDSSNKTAPVVRINACDYDDVPDLIYIIPTTKNE